MKEAKPGDVVQLTGYFLRATGQMLGPEGQSRWTVQACDCDSCRTGRFVATNERVSHPEMFWTPEELAADPRLLQRHIALANLQLVGKLPNPNDMADAVPPIAPQHLRRRGRR